MVASSSFVPLGQTIAFSYGATYLAVGGVKLFKAWREKRRNPEILPLPRGEKFFFLSAAVLLAFPFIQDAMQGRITPGPPPVEPSPVIRMIGLAFIGAGLAMVYTAPFFPWLIMLQSEKYRHLRRHAKLGLAMAAVLPFVVLIAMLAWS